VNRIPGASDLRAALNTAGAVAALNIGLGAGLAVGLLRGDRRLGNELAQSLGFASFLATAGVRVSVVGEHNLWTHRPAVFVMNHQSGLDAMIAGALLRHGFSGLLKQEAKYSPATFLVGQTLDAVFVDRADPEKGRAAQEQLVERLRSGLSLLVAPEGTRSDTGELGPFKSGAFHVARTAGVPIVPIVLRSAYELMPGKSLLIRPGVVDVAVLEPIPTAGWTVKTVRDDVAAVRKQFVETLKNWPVQSQ
jgi:putative phosphoserine phosphatase / 1-acylglycerol-3-phosphate O-acyltransferase